MVAREGLLRKIAMLAALLLGTGCTNKDDGDPSIPPDTDTQTTPATGDTGPLPPGPDLVLLPEHNYTATVDWVVQSAEVRHRWDLLLSWDALTTDAWGEPIEPANIDTLALIEVLYPPDEVGEHLAKDDFGNNLLSIWEADVVGRVFAHASDFANGQTPFNPQGLLVEEPGKTWLLAAARREGERLDLRAALGLQIVENSPLVSADLVSESSQITWSAQASETHLLTASGAELYTLDWEGIVTDALGKEYDDRLGDELFIARYDEGVDLSTQVLSLQEAASGLWTMDVERETDARLDLARDGAGGTFPGFLAGPTWLIGVRCTTCMSPFPLWVATVDVVDP